MLLGILRSFVNGFQQNSSTDLSSPRPRNYERRVAYRWLYKNIFSTFRYGMVLLYVGTLLIVIGYHNPSIIFARYIGMVLVVVGLLCIGGAIICGFQRYIFGEENDIDREPDRAESTDSKRSLPTYDNAVNLDLPTYEEAMILKEADDANRQRNTDSTERSGLPSTSSNQQLTLWPSIGHYSSRISPIVEVEEHPTTTVASSTQTIATISHGGELIPSPVSPPLYQESVIRNTGTENIPIQQDDELIQLHYENQIQPLQKINSGDNQRNKRRHDHSRIRNETRAELILAPSFSRSPINRPSTVLPILTYRNETRVNRERYSSTTSSFPTNHQSSSDCSTTQELTDHAIESSGHMTYNLDQQIHPNQGIDEADNTSMDFAEEDNPRRRTFDELVGHSRSNSILNRPRTSVTRPGTTATLFLESCSTSLYSEASFDDDSSSILSDWDDLPSIESLGSQTNQQACTESDLILENLEVGNIEDNNNRNSLDSTLLPNEDMSTQNRGISSAENELDYVRNLELQKELNQEQTYSTTSREESNKDEDNLKVLSITFDDTEKLSLEQSYDVTKENIANEKLEEDLKLTSITYDTTMNMHSI